MENVWRKLKVVFTDKSLRGRILFVLLAFVVFRILANIPVPGIGAVELGRVLNNNQFLGILNIFSGGGLSNLSLMMLGVGPYITSSIIMQLLGFMVPAVKRMQQEEGEIGRKKISNYTRLFAVPLAIVQGLSLLALLKNQGIIGSMTTFEHFASIATIVAGSMLLMWIGELVSEFGIGNGVSLIIFAGIIAGLPASVSQFIFTFDVSQLPLYILLFALGLLIVAGVVVVTEAERPIPVTYAKHVRGLSGSSTGGAQTYIPLRVNQAGVIPIIFALSILIFPQMIGNLLINSSVGILQSISKAMLWFSATTWLYSIVYFMFVFIFTYFYTAVTFDPNQLAENLQKNGAFVPGIRPGNATREYISHILNRITLVGAIFLGVIAVLPLVIRSITNIQAFAVGGTALLIVVSVVLDLIKKVEAELSMREY